VVERGIDRTRARRYCRTSGPTSERSLVSAEKGRRIDRVDTSREWTPGEVMADGRVLFRMRGAPDWTEIVEADQLESKPADYTIRPRRR